MTSSEKILVEMGDKLYIAERLRLVQDIKLDAYKAGMTRAAEVVMKQLDTAECEPECICRQVVPACSQACLTERNNLKEIP